MTLEAVIASARRAVDYHRRGYGPFRDFDANTMIRLMDEFGAALDEYETEKQIGK